MSKKTKTVALFIVLSMAAVSCQKENFNDVIGNQTEVTMSRSVSYMIDGTLYHATIHSNSEWDALMHNLLALARNGYRVTLANGNNVNTSPLSKEIVTFTTTSEAEANHWADQMLEAGYSVTIMYDKKTGIYTCTAVK